MRIEVRDVGCWKDFEDFHESLLTGRDPAKVMWVFRGQADFSWELKTALDRAADDFSLNREDLPLIEEGMVREFQRRVGTSRADIDLPARSNILAWLALMRHHGAPTRLLDWSYSLYVALFFAVETAREDSAVWAIDVNWCSHQSRQLLPPQEDAEARTSNDPYLEQPDTFRFLFARNPAVRLVYRVNTFALPHRLSSQKGLFLGPGDIRVSFEENLKALEAISGGNGGSAIYKLRIRRSLRNEVFQRLFEMNISRETLFPDLDGLAQSLRTRLASPEALLPTWRRRRQTEPFADW